MANFMDFELIQGLYILCTSEASVTKVDVHQRIIVIFIYFKFHEIPSNSHFVIAPDGQTDMYKTISLRLRRGKIWKYITNRKLYYICRYIFLMPYPKEKRFFLVCDYSF